MRLNPKVTDELCTLCVGKTAAADAYNAAVKTQAAKIQVDPGVLKKYISAKLAGDVNALRVEAEQIDALVEDEQ